MVECHEGILFFDGEFIMNWSDKISVFCSCASFVVTVIIGRLQIMQAKRMENFEKRQDERDEFRHMEKVKAQAVSFISKYYRHRGLIPLCAIAALYNDLFCYKRKMYRDFCCLTMEVQNLILKYEELDLGIITMDSFFNKCLFELNNVIRTNFPSDKQILYDDGKLLEKCPLGTVLF